MTSVLDSQMGDLLAAIADSARLLVRERQSAIPAILERLGHAVQADRALYMPIRAHGAAPRLHQFTIEHEWISDREKVLPLAVGLPDPVSFVGRDYDFTRRLDLLRSGRPVVYGNLRALPTNETALAQKFGTRSSVRVPVFVAGQLTGMLGLDHVLSVWPWRGDELHALWLPAELLGRAMEGFGRAESRASPPGNATANRAISMWVRHGIQLFGDRGWRAALPPLLAELGSLYDLRRATWWDETFGAVRLVHEWHGEKIEPLPRTFRDPGVPADHSTWHAWTERNRCFVTARGAAKGNLGHLVLQARRDKGLRELPIGPLLQPLANLVGAASELGR